MARGPAPKRPTPPPDALLLDIASEHSSDDYEATQTSRKRPAKGKQAASRKRQRTAAKRRRRHDDDDDDEDDSDEDSLEESDVSPEPEEQQEEAPRISRSGRPMRSAATTKEYVDPDSDTSEEPSDSDEGFKEELDDPLPDIQPPSLAAPASLVLKLSFSDTPGYRSVSKKLTNAPTNPSRPNTRSGGKRPATRQASRAASVDSNPGGHRRSSRLTRASAEPLVQLTDSGNHAVEVPGRGEAKEEQQSGPEEYMGYATKRPTMSAIAEETTAGESSEHPDKGTQSVRPVEEPLTDVDIDVAESGPQENLLSQGVSKISSQGVIHETSQAEADQLTLSLDQGLPAEENETIAAPEVELEDQTRRRTSIGSKASSHTKRRKAADRPASARQSRKRKAVDESESSDFNPAGESGSSDSESDGKDGDTEEVVSDSSEDIRRSNKRPRVLHDDDDEFNPKSSQRRVRGRLAMDDYEARGEYQMAPNDILSGPKSSRPRPSYLVQQPPLDSDPFSPQDQANPRGNVRRPRGGRGQHPGPGWIPVNATDEQIAAHRAANPDDSSNDEGPAKAGPAAASRVPMLGMPKAPNAATAPIRPDTIDTSTTFDNIGGLKPILEQLREMVNVPFLYAPEVASGAIPAAPSGVLFHGPPGTGKTMAARALAATLKKEGHNVTLYIKKGSDLMSKYVGEAERNVKNLFDEAALNAPSIIFFDEFDGIAPVRGAGGESHHYNSVVATLLASMDGLISRGQIIIIAATNRPEHIDPAFRRPGRFDREFYFTLPNEIERESILDLYTTKSPLTPALRQSIAKMTPGYSGADLKALCHAAQMNSVKRTYPQIFLTDQRLQIDSQKIKITHSDYQYALQSVKPTVSRSGRPSFEPMPKHLMPLLGRPLGELTSLVRKILPIRKQISVLEDAQLEQYNDPDGGEERIQMQHEFETRRIYRPRCLIQGLRGQGQAMLASALLFQLEGVYVQPFDLATLTSEEKSLSSTMASLFAEVKRHSPSVIYIRDIDVWWQHVGDEGRAIFLSYLDQLGDQEPILLLATLKQEMSDLQAEMIQELFAYSSRNRFTVERPNRQSRQAFFEEATSKIRKAPNEFPAAEARKKRKLEELQVVAPLNIRPTSAKIADQLIEDRRVLSRLGIWLSTFFETSKKSFPVFTKHLIGKATTQVQLDLDERLADGTSRFEFTPNLDGPTHIRDRSSGIILPCLTLRDIARQAEHYMWTDLGDLERAIGWFEEEAKLAKQFFRGVTPHANLDRTLGERLDDGSTLLVEFGKLRLQIEQELGIETLQSLHKRRGGNRRGPSNPSTQTTASSLSFGPEFDNSDYAQLFDRVPLHIPTAAVTSENLDEPAVNLARPPSFGASQPTISSGEGSLVVAAPPASAALTSSRGASIADLLNHDPTPVSQSAGASGGIPLANGSSSSNEVLQPIDPPLPQFDEPLLGRVVQEFVERTSGCSVDQLEQVQRAVMETIWDNRMMPNRIDLLRLVVAAVDAEISDIDRIQGIMTSTPEDAEAAARRHTPWLY